MATRTILATALLLATSVPILHHPVAAATRPNILLVISDDWGWPYYGFMIDRLAAELPDWDPAPSVACGPGTPSTPCQLHICTPNLDRLAHEGIAFENGYVTAPHCTLSHESFYSGLNRRDLAAFNNTLGCAAPTLQAPDGRPQTIPEALGSPHATTVEDDTRLGYNTVLKGKWWLGAESNFFNDRTFDPVSPTDINYQSENDKSIGETKTLEGLKKWIKAQHSDTPWFAVWAPEMPHASFSGIEEHAPSISGFYDHMEIKNLPLITTTNYPAANVPEYFESMSYFDARLGEIVQFLDQLECGQSVDPTADAPVPDYTGSWPGHCPAPVPYEDEETCTHPSRYAGFRKNTLILYLADNGAGLDDSKAHFTENGIRTPILAYYPNGIPSSDERDLNPTGYTPHPAPIGAIDLFPTILEYAGEAGLAPPGGGPIMHRLFPDARSFRALAADLDAYDPAVWRGLGRRYFFSNVTTGSTGLRAVRDSCPAKYVESAGPGNAPVPSPAPFKLYNNTQNPTPKPKRLTNLARDPFEILYRPDDFFISEQDAGEDEPKYFDNTAVEPALKSALISWWDCPSKAASSQLVRRSLAVEACENVPVRCPNDASCSNAPSVAPCEAAVSTSTACPPGSPY